VESEERDNEGGQVSVNQMNLMKIAVEFAPLTRQMYSDTTWSGDSFINQIISDLVSGVSEIAQFQPVERGENLGHSILHLRDLVIAHTEDNSVAQNKDWRDEYEQIVFTLDAHIAYNAYSQQVGYQVSWQEAAQKIMIYALSDRLADVFNEATGGDASPELEVGIDFVERVIADIIN
jgi:hypothetical protein